MNADKQLYLRKGTEEDLDLIYRWANDPVTRANSFSTDPIPYQDHVNWFHRMLNNPDRILYIMMADTKPVGQIRLDMEGEEAEISYSIAPKERGKGYGQKIIKLICEEVQKNMPEVLTLVASVKEANLASQKCFLSNGFEGNDTFFRWTNK